MERLPNELLQLIAYHYAILDARDVLAQEDILELVREHGSPEMMRRFMQYPRMGGGTHADA